MRSPRHAGLLAATLVATGFSSACSAHPREQSVARPPERVRLTTQDGGVVFADAYGAGDRGVVLAHGGRFTKESWAEQARALATAGFHVLAIDFRGYGASRGPGQADIYTAPLHLDVLAGVRHLRATGATSVSAIGGSMGGAAAANAVGAAPGEIDRLVLIGATPDGPPEQLKLPKLYIMSRDDANAGGPRLPGLRAHVDKAPQPKELIVLDGSAHAQFIFETEHAERVMREIVRFLNAGVAGGQLRSMDPRQEESPMVAISKDGTRVAYWRSGSGPLLLLVHGTTADHTRWARLLPNLEQHFTVYAMDRRGRGGSGSGASYAIEREFEDIAAVVAAIGEPLFLLGHSYGAVCSLEASLLTDEVRRLILYEPPIPTGEPLAPPGVAERIQALVDAGDSEAGLELFFREIVRMPDGELASYRALPAWKVRVTLAPTIARELAVERNYRFQPERFAGFSIPTLLLVGGASPPVFRQATDVLAGALPDSRIVVMPGQRHVAMDTAPELFLAEVGRFLGAAIP